MNGTRFNLTLTDEFDCAHVKHLCQIDGQCNFTRTALNCMNTDGFINYIQLTYCTIKSEPYSVIILALFLTILFFAIGTNADDFLCPILISISKSLKLSDNIAGVTFLAIGNGSPDIFSSIIGITDSNPNLVIGQLYGAGIFVTTIVVGTILWRENFEIMKRPLIRDILFYLVTATLVWSIFLAEKILLYHSILFIIIYLIYVIVVIISGNIYKRQQRTNGQWSMLNLIRCQHRSYPSPMPRENLNYQTKYIINNNNNNINKYDNDVNLMDSYGGVALTRIKLRQYFQDPLKCRRLTLYHIYSDSERKFSLETNGKINVDNVNNEWINPNGIYSIQLNEDQRRSNNAVEYKTIHYFDDWNQCSNKQNNSINNETILRKIFTIVKNILTIVYKHNHQQRIEMAEHHIDNNNNVDQSIKFDLKLFNFKLLIKKIIEISRFDLKLFSDINFYGKINMIAKAPIYLIYTLTIPVVHDSLPDNGWIKYLNLWHLIISPQICIWILKIRFINVYHLHLLMLMVSIVLFILVWCSSVPNEPPRYHILFAYFGFIVSISWIYAIANEVVHVLDALRIIFNLSKFIIGLTIGALGNSVGDFLSNLSMAKNGFPRMAISACFGGPVLNMLLGIGIPFTIQFLRKQTNVISIEYGRMVTVLYGTITISLLTTLIILLFVTKFQSTRIHSFILYTIYVCFYIAVVLTEMQIF